MAATPAINMNRIIKFKVWDSEEASCLESYANRGETFFRKQEGKYIDIGWFLQCERLENPTRYFISQYTGFNDKNNREIFEGDTLTATIKHKNEKGDKSRPIIKGTVEFNNEIGQFLVRYTYDKFKTSIALNGLYDIHNITKR